jgi:hypothetical protein
MSQDLSTLPQPRSHYLTCCHIGFRFLRGKCSPWVTLAIAPLNLLFASGMNRTHEKNRCMRAASKIDFVGFYALLNDLLW